MNIMNMISKKNRLALTIAALMAAPMVHAADVNISGFLSVEGGMVDDEDGVAYKGYTEEDFTFDRNILGLQVSGQVNEKVTATAQLIARSGNDYEVTADWVYISWQASENGKVRAGRLRTPLYMYSDYLDVGYAYPWISAPNEVYHLPFNNVDGIDYYLTSALGSFDTSFQAYFGSLESDFAFEDGTKGYATLRNQMGVAATIGKSWWTLRAAYHQVDLSVDINEGQPIGDQLAELIKDLSDSPFASIVPSIAIDEDKATFGEIGINIDTGMFVAAAEHVEFEVKDSLLAKNVRDYVMVGVRVSDFLFHVTGSKTDDEIANLTGSIPVSAQTQPHIDRLNAAAAARDIDREVISYGVRWDVASGTALKLQLDDVDDLNGEQKLLSAALQAVF